MITPDDTVKGLNMPPQYSMPAQFLYYKKITIQVMDKHTYNVICWGDRNSILWDFKKDKIFYVDVDYNKSQKIKTGKDLAILHILKKCK